MLIYDGQVAWKKVFCTDVVGLYMTVWSLYSSEIVWLYEGSGEVRLCLYEDTKGVKLYDFMKVLRK